MKRQRSIKEYSTPIIGNTERISNQSEFVAYAKNFLNKVIKDVGADRSDVEAGINKWLKDDVHGVEHSYFVFETAKKLAKSERLKCSTHKLFLLSIFHDMSEFLPLFNHDNGQSVIKVDSKFVSSSNQQQQHAKKEQRWKAENHPKLMAWLVRSVGSKIGLNTKELSQLARDIFYHDMFWDRPTKSQVDKYKKTLSNEGKILHDSDRLVMENGKNDNEVLYDNIKRTESYGVGREHFFRTLSLNERLDWWKRSGGLFDTLMPLLVEFNAPSYIFLTNKGKKMYEKKRTIFEKELLKFLKQKYDHERLVAKTYLGKHKHLIYGIKGSDEYRKISGRNLGIISNKLCNMNVNFLSTKERKYYGYSFFIDGQWIDPSITKYRTFSKLKREVVKSIRQYKNQ